MSNHQQYKCIIIVTISYLVEQKQKPNTGSQNAAGSSFVQHGRIRTAYSVQQNHENHEQETRNRIRIQSAARKDSCNPVGSRRTLQQGRTFVSRLQLAIYDMMHGACHMHPAGKVFCIYIYSCRNKILNKAENMTSQLQLQLQYARKIRTASVYIFKVLAKLYRRCHKINHNYFQIILRTKSCTISFR